MSLKVVTAAGAAAGAATVTLPKGTELKPAALAQAVQAALANEQRHRPVVKTRGLVRGGGAKPHRQKGTGRARAGSSRSPLWRGGGIIFGPSGEDRPRKNVNRKLARSALLALLNARADDDSLVVVTGKLSFEQTKAAAQFFQKLGVAGRVLVLVTPDEADQVRGFYNLAGLTVQTVPGLRLSEVVRHATMVTTQAALQELTTAKPTAAPAPSAAKATAGASKATTAKTPVRKTAPPAKKAAA